jgi:acetyl esterase/lipase
MSAATAVLDSTIRELIDELAAEKAPPIYTLSPEEARKTLLRAQSGPVEKPEAQIKDYNANTTAGPLRMRSIRPVGVKTPTAVVLYFHGGGWVLGDAVTHDRLVRELAAGTGATIVFVEYGRAPEHRYPVAIEQAYAATRYVAEHADEFEVDSTRLTVAGDSAGGNMAAVVALLAKQRSAPRIKGQLLFYPVTNADSTPHRTTNSPMALANQACHAVVLGSVSSRSQQTARAQRLTSSGIPGSARRFTSRARYYGRKRCSARRRRSLWPQVVRGWSRNGCHASQGRHPRFRAAQPDCQSCTRSRCIAASHRISQGRTCVTVPADSLKTPCPNLLCFCRGVSLAKSLH